MNLSLNRPGLRFLPALLFAFLLCLNSNAFAQHADTAGASGVVFTPIPTAADSMAALKKSQHKAAEKTMTAKKKKATGEFIKVVGLKVWAGHRW